MARPDFAPKIDDAFVARYEELRSQVMGGLGNGMGLALFVRQGMRSWIEAWRYCTLGTPPAQHQPEPAVPAPRYVPNSPCFWPAWCYSTIRWR